MSSLHVAAAHWQWRGIELRYSQGFNSDGGSGDINDGIDCSNFMEMHFFNTGAMNNRFSFRQAFKDSDCHFSHTRRKRGGFHQRYDVRKVARLLLLIWRDDFKIRALYAFILKVLELEFIALERQSA